MACGVLEMAEEYCVYASVKMDVALINLAKQAAAKSGKSIQEWLSDVVNDAASRQVRERPVKRLPPRPRKKADRE